MPETYKRFFLLPCVESAAVVEAVVGCDVVAVKRLRKNLDFENVIKVCNL